MSYRTMLLVKKKRFAQSIYLFMVEGYSSPLRCDLGKIKR